MALTVAARPGTIVGSPLAGSRFAAFMASTVAARPGTIVGSPLAGSRFAAFMARAIAAMKAQRAPPSRSGVVASESQPVGSASTRSPMSARLPPREGTPPSIFTPTDSSSGSANERR